MNALEVRDRELFFLLLEEKVSIMGYGIMTYQFDTSKHSFQRNLYERNNTSK